MALTEEIIIKLRAEAKELRKSLEDVKKTNKGLNTEFKKQNNLRVKEQKDFWKQQEHSRKAERVHIQVMSREETKRFRSTQQQNNSLIRQNKQLGGGGGGGLISGRGSKFLSTSVSSRGLGDATKFVGGALAGAGLAAAGMVIGAAVSGYQKYMQLGATLGRSIGLAPGRNIRQGLRGAGRGLGFSQIDVAEAMPSTLRATGTTNVREALLAQRATGMEGGEVAGAFGAIKRLGTGFGRDSKGADSAGANVLKRIMAAGTASGLEKSRVPELLEGALGIAEDQQSRQVGKIDPTEYAKLLAMMGKAGPGMQGAAGARVLGKLQQGIVSPGGGEFGESFVRQAMGFGRPGGTTGFYQAEKMREKGATPENVQRIMGEIKSQFGTGEEGNLALRELTGVSLEQAEALQNIFNSGKSSEEQMKAIKKIMDDAKPLEKQAQESMVGVGKDVSYIAKLTDQGINIGKLAAKDIQSLEKLQHQFLIKIIELVSDVKSIFNFITDTFGTKQQKAAADIKTLEELKKVPLSEDAETRMKQVNERSRIAMRAGIATGNKSVIADLVAGTVATTRKVLSGEASVGDVLSMKPARTAISERSEIQAAVEQELTDQKTLLKDAYDMVAAKRKADAAKREQENRSQKGKGAEGAVTPPTNSTESSDKIVKVEGHASLIINDSARSVANNIVRLNSGRIG